MAVTFGNTDRRPLQERLDELPFELMSYTTDVDRIEYTNRWYTVDIVQPKKGLIVGESQTGFGNGSQACYIVLETRKNKKGIINKAIIAPVYGWDPSEMTCRYDPRPEKRGTLVQTYDKCGHWKWQGDRSIGSANCSFLYGFIWGEPRKWFEGYDK